MIQTHVLAVFGFLIGAWMVLATLLSAIRTFVLPRAVRTFLTASVFRAGRWVFEVIATGGVERRDRIMAMYMPITILGLAGCWLTIVLAGYTLMFWASGYGTMADSVWVSGSSLLTLGSARIDGLAPRLLAFTEASIGLGLVALLIAYLPTVYSAFMRRERMVALLEVRAGSPPSAVAMLIRFHRIGRGDDLDGEWQRWESWFADIEESHTTHSMVVWLRSPRAGRSWVTAAGTVLDAASLVVAAVERPRDPTAQLCIRAGFVALRQIADGFGISHDADPAPDDPISITRREFDEACAALDEAGVPLVADRDQAWRDWAGWRVNYDTVLLRLAELTSAPTAPWVSDRSPVDHRRTSFKLWLGSLGGRPPDTAASVIDRRRGDPRDG